MVFELDSEKLEQQTSSRGNSRRYLHEFGADKLKVVIKIDEHYDMEVPTLLALKDSPHVLPVVDTGFVDHVPAFMTPHVDQIFFVDLCKAEPSLQFRYVSHLLQSVCFMHDHGVAHCDIKPDNFLFSTDQKGYLIDFGSAMTKPACSDENWVIQLKSASEYRGTHGYLPPEMFKECLAARSVIPEVQRAPYETSKLTRMTASALPACSYVVTPASDIYSCGVVIMMLFYGLPKSPFAAKVTDMGANMAQIDNKKKKKMLKLGSLLNWCQFYGGQLQLSPQAQTHFKDCLECVNVNSELPIRGTTPPTCLSLYDLAMQMLHFDPTKRPTAAECLDKLKVIMRVHECVAKTSPLLLDDTEQVLLSVDQRKRMVDCCQRGFEGQVFYRRCIVCGRDLHGRENVSCDTCHKGYRQGDAKDETKADQEEASRFNCPAVQVRQVAGDAASSKAYAVQLAVSISVPVSIHLFVVNATPHPTCSHSAVVFSLCHARWQSAFFSWPPFSTESRVSTTMDQMMM
ncbi:Protein kinase domain [Carpediemonas membranifera]|uniref:Protein kinase domain n=1 Tax=Carpediemonas membranifera TaxID=201153 RepID=A0A8J6B200_9EUKA|nr:Protein kinase domain [Carpediemonas membranifera]|eukprot:KAG9391292.1 Protein kinase domain [Carpediemonas membranifera]